MKIHHFDGIYQERWGFSWAMLVYQRVMFFTLNDNSMFFLVNLSWFEHDSFKVGLSFPHSQVWLILMLFDNLYWHPKIHSPRIYVGHFYHTKYKVNSLPFLSSCSTLPLILTPLGPMAMLSPKSNGPPQRGSKKNGGVVKQRAGNQRAKNAAFRRLGDLR